LILAKEFLNDANEEKFTMIALRLTAVRLSDRHSTVTWKPNLWSHIPIIYVSIQAFYASKLLRVYFNSTANICILATDC